MRETLTGDLTVREVPATWRRLAAELPDEIDLAGIERIDSSALALLLECRANANATGRRIEFQNPPDTLRTIARLTQIDELLGWDTTADSEGKSD